MFLRVRMLPTSSSRRVPTNRYGMLNLVLRRTFLLLKKIVVVLAKFSTIYFFVPVLLLVQYQPLNLVPEGTFVPVRATRVLHFNLVQCTTHGTLKHNNARRIFFLIYVNILSD